MSGLVGLRTLYLGKATFKDQNVARHGYFTDAGLRKLQKLSRLFAVSLDYSEVTGTGLDAFKDLQTWEYFGCTYSPFNDDGMKNLARMPKMKKLNLSNTQITSKGLVHLKGLKMLEDLYMDGTKITDDGLQHLLALKRLRYLNFADTLVTPKAGKAATRRLAT